MKIFRAMLLALPLTLLAAAFAMANDYYIVKGASGEKEILEWDITTRGEIVEGPFTTMEKAKEALKGLREGRPEQAEKKEKPQKDSDKKGAAKEAVQPVKSRDNGGADAAQKDMKQDKEFYLIETGDGELKVVDHAPKGGAKALKGPFASEDEARKALEAVSKARKEETLKKAKEGAKPASQKQEPEAAAKEEASAAQEKERVEAPSAQASESPEQDKDLKKEEAKEAQKEAASGSPQKQEMAKDAAGDKGKEGLEAKEEAPKVKETSKSDTPAKARDSKQEPVAKEAPESKASQQIEETPAQEAVNQKAEKTRAKYSRCLSEKQAKRIGAYYVIVDEVGRMAIRRDPRDNQIVFGPFRTTGEAAASMMNGNCSR